MQNPPKPNKTQQNPVIVLLGVVGFCWVWGGLYNTWLLIAVLRFLDGDTESIWNLIKAIGYDKALDDDAISYFLIE